MIKNLLRHGLPALALTALSLLATAVPATAAATLEEGSAVTETAVDPAGAMRGPVPLFEAIDRLPVAEEHRTGYKRDLYKHGNKGLNSGDGCDTRKEVVLAEAVEARQVAAGYS